MSYVVNEIFHSLQGEGARVGEVSTFVRFAGCNLTCKVETHGFDCDTEFVGGRKMDADQLLAEVKVAHAGDPAAWIVFTGGEPLLQLDLTLVLACREAGYKIAVETNGSLPMPEGVTVDWLACSPKVAEHALRLERCDELRYVRFAGQAKPRPRLAASHHFLSPAWTPLGVDRKALAWCVELCKANPDWKLSLQTHKWTGIR